MIVFGQRLYGKMMQCGEAGDCGPGRVLPSIGEADDCRPGRVLSSEGR